MESTRARRLQLASEATNRHAWGEALESFSAADSEEPLEPDGLEAMAAVAYWAGHLDECLKAWERAHAAHLKRGDQRRAAAAALQIALRQSQQLNPALARGWRATAERLLEGDPDCQERGQLYGQEAYGLLTMGKLEEAYERASQAFEVGARCGARNIQAMALNVQGQALIKRGEIDRGLRLVDESMAAASTGDLDVSVTGAIYCWTIAICRDLADFERAGELTEATSAWCEENGVTAFSGICRIHRAELFRLHGDLARAEEEARSALEDLLPRGLVFAARAFNELGLICLRRGQLDAAAEAFERAKELGAEAEPGSSLLELARGRYELAQGGLTRAIARHPATLLDRAGLLSAMVEVALVGEDNVTAAGCVVELESIAETAGRSAFRALAAVARGALLVSERQPGAAIGMLGAGLELWITLDAPYEAARTRLLISEAYRAQGDDRSADFELQLAVRAFERIGAEREQALITAAGSGAQEADPLQPLTRRQQQVARLVAEGQSNRDIAAKLVVSERTAEYHVQQILNKLGFDSRAQIAAWYARRR